MRLSSLFSSTAENGLRDDLLELGRREADYVFHPC